jgi:hypothetical protein
LWRLVADIVSRVTGLACPPAADELSPAAESSPTLAAAAAQAETAAAAKAVNQSLHAENAQAATSAAAAVAAAAVATAPVKPVEPAFVATPVVGAASSAAPSAQRTSSPLPSPSPKHWRDDGSIERALAGGACRPFDAVLVLGGGAPPGPNQQLPFVENRCAAAAAVRAAHFNLKTPAPVVLCLSAGTAHCPQLLSPAGLPIWEATVSASSAPAVAFIFSLSLSVDLFSRSLKLPEP